MTLLRLIGLLLALLSAPDVFAANVYWANNAGSQTPTCANIRTTGTADDPGDPPASFGSITGAANCATAAGDVVNVVDDGTYSAAKHRLTTQFSANSLSLTGLKSGTSGNPTIVQGDPRGARPYIHMGAWFQTYPNSTGTAERSWLKFRHLHVDGTNVDTGNGTALIKVAGNNVVFEDMEVEGAYNVNFFFDGAREPNTSTPRPDLYFGHRMSRIDCHGSAGAEGGTGDGHGYCFYMTSANGIVEDSHIYGTRAGGGQFTSALWTVNGSTFRRNYVHGILVSQQGASTGMCFGIAVGGRNSLVHDNIIDMAGCAGTMTNYGLGIAFSSSNGGYSGDIYNNIILNSILHGIFLSGASNSAALNPVYNIYNNIIVGYGTAAINTPTPSGSASAVTVNKTHNACIGSGTENCNSSNPIVIAGLTDITVSSSDFRHKVGSLGINAGRTVPTRICVGVCDLGPFEVPAITAATVNENSVDVTVGHSYAPIGPASGQTGWTVLVGGVARTTLSAAPLPGADGIVRINFSGAACAGGNVVTLNYAPGNVEDSAGIADLYNQGLQAVTGQAVTNSCGTPAPSDPGAPVIKYDFNEGAGLTTTNLGSSGAGDNGTLTNFTGTIWVPGASGTGLRLTNGIENYVAVPHGSGLNPTTQSMSWCLGILPSVDDLSVTKIYVGPRLGTNQRAYIGQSSGYWTIGIREKNIESFTTEFPVVNQYTRACIRLDKDTPGGGTGTATLIINGTPGTSSSSVKTYTSFTFASDIQIGTVSNGAFYYSSADIDDFTFWSAALSNAEFVEDYDAWRPASPPPSGGDLEQAGHRFYGLLLHGGVVRPFAAANVNIELPPGAAFALVTQTDCTGDDCSSVGQKLHYTCALCPTSAGAALAVGDVPGPDQVSFTGNLAQPGLLSGQFECCVTGALTPNAGDTQFDSAAIPAFTLTEGASIVQRRMLTIGRGAEVGWKYCFTEKNQTGQDLSGGYTPPDGACVTVGRPAASGAGF